MSEQLELRLLGGMQIICSGAPITGHGSKKAQALLSYLAITGRAHSRDELAGLLWGDMPDAEAKANLRGVLFNLRQLAAPFLRIDRQIVAFNRHAPYWLDVARFQSGLGQLEAVESEGQLAALREAMELYHGDLMEGFYVRDAPAFEEWLMLEREQLRQRAIQGLYILATYHTAQGEHALAIRYTARLLEIEPCHEEAHRQLMLLLALNGQRSAALAQYETCRRILAGELRVEPAEETIDLYQRIRKATWSMLQQPAADVRRLTTNPRSGLRLASLPFVGRAAEYAWLFHQWDAARCSAGVLTLVQGAAGTGKTRLIEELLRYASGSGAMLLRGRCHCFEHDLPYQPVVEIVRELFQHMPSVFRALPKYYVVELSRLLPELQTLAPDLAALSSLNDEATRQRLFEAVTQLFITLVNNQPSVVLFLDDLQHADPPTVDLLRYLLYRLHGSSLWCVGAYRPEEVAVDSPVLLLLHDLGRMQRRALLQLAPLDAWTGAQLISILPGLPGSQAQQLVSYLNDAAEGNAFILAQLLQDLEQRGILAVDSDAWQLDRQRFASARADIPESVRAMSLGRVSRLPPTARAVLEMAAMSGPTFDLRLLVVAFDQNSQDVDECIEILLARHLVRETRNAISRHQHTAPANETDDRLPRTPGSARIIRYEFTHTMIRRVICASLSPGQQQRLQDRITQAQLDTVSHAATTALDRGIAAPAAPLRRRTRTVA